MTMINNHFRVALAFLFCALTITSAHGQGLGMGMGRKLGKIDQLEKLKLIEALNMNEEVSIKFFSRYAAFKNKQRRHVAELDSLANELNRLMEAKSDNQQLKKAMDDYFRIESLFHSARLDFVTSLSDILTIEQTAKLVVFERNFRKEMQEIIIGQGKRWREGRKDR